LGGEPVIGLDVVGGIAGLAEAMLGAAGFRLVHVSGLAVNRARQGTSGGEHKSDARDARVIAEQVRTRRDLRPIEAVSELDLELRLLVGRRGDLQVEQTRRLARLHDLLVGIHPGLERMLDLTSKSGLWLVSRYVTPAEVRAGGREGLVAHLRAAGGCRAARFRPGPSGPWPPPRPNSSPSLESNWLPAWSANWPLRPWPAASTSSSWTQS
jgi:hypothetical protein